MGDEWPKRSSPLTWLGDTLRFISPKGNIYFSFGTGSGDRAGWGNLPSAACFLLPTSCLACLSGGQIHQVISSTTTSSQPFGRLSFCAFLAQLAHLRQIARTEENGRANELAVRSVSCVIRFDRTGTVTPPPAPTQTRATDPIDRTGRLSIYGLLPIELTSFFLSSFLRHCSHRCLLSFSSS